MDFEIVNGPVKTDTSYAELGEGWDEIGGSEEDLNTLQELQQQLTNMPIPDAPTPQQLSTKPGDKICCQFKVGERQQDGKKEQVTKQGEYTIKSYDKPTYTLEGPDGKEYRVGEQAIEPIDPEYMANMEAFKKAAQEFDEAANKLKEEIEELKKKLHEEYMANTVELSSLEPKDQLQALIQAGMVNIWMVGPAGAGKSTMARDVAIDEDLPFLCCSCGIGTSAAEFIGYKYPAREATKFSEYYGKKSIILIDEFTSLDHAVAQVLNAALANGEIETTTGTVKRHPECIIIATSNTFGGGGSRQYVANNQLDASTIDRYVGAIIEVNYSTQYESKYDSQVVAYVELLRKCIKQNDIRKVASTRMIQAGTRLRKSMFRDWKARLIINWTDSEKNQLKEFMKKHTAVPIDPVKKPSMGTYEWGTLARPDFIQEMEARMLQGLARSTHGTLAGVN